MQSEPAEWIDQRHSAAARNALDNTRDSVHSFSHPFDVQPVEVPMRRRTALAVNALVSLSPLVAGVIPVIKTGKFTVGDASTN